MISFVRVDNRLIHGQVVEAWLGYLSVRRILVADDEAAQSPLVRAAMGLAVPPSVDVRILPMAQADFALEAQDAVRTLVLFRDVAGAVEAHQRGLALASLNLGNVHFSAGRVQVTPSVFLSLEELDQLRMLSAAGVAVEVRAVPTDRPFGLKDLEERFRQRS